MTTAGELLLSLSSLPSGATAEDHLESITAGTTVTTVIGEDTLSLEPQEIAIEIPLDTAIVINVENSAAVLNFEDPEITLKVEEFDEL